MAIGVFNLKMRDTENATKTVPFYFDTATIDTVAEVQSIVTTLAGYVNAVSNCTVIGAELVSFPLTVPVDAGGAVSGSRVDAGAFLSFTNENGKRDSVYIPGFAGSLLNEGFVIAEETDVVNLVDYLTDTAGITDKNGLDLVAFTVGKQTTRNT